MKGFLHYGPRYKLINKKNRLTDGHNGLISGILHLAQSLQHKYIIIKPKSTFKNKFSFDKYRIYKKIVATM